MRDLSDVVSPPPRTVPLLPAGVIRAAPEDFCVEELPAYEPCGSGSHLYLFVEKRELAARELVRRLGTALRIRDREIGVAGQKDRHAVTRQWVSVPAACESRIAAVESADLKILDTRLHTNKLRTGHLRGNRFRLIIRPLDRTWSPADVGRVQARLTDLQQNGFPNYFGPQRFGHNASTLRRGLQLLGPPDHAPRRTQPWLRRLALSSVQSAIFNCVVADRVRLGTLADPQPGDVVIRKGGTKPFLFQPPSSEAAATGDADAETHRLLPAGPLPGPSMLAAGDDVAATEHSLLTEFGLTMADFTRYAKLCQGTRRLMPAFPDDVACALTSDGFVELTFSLTAGSFATVLLQELLAEVRDHAAHEKPGSVEEPGEADLSDAD